VAEGARPSTVPQFARQTVANAASVVVLPEPAGPTSASSKWGEVRMASVAARWSLAKTSR